MDIYKYLYTFTFIFNNHKEQSFTNQFFTTLETLKYEKKQTHYPFSDGAVPKNGFRAKARTRFGQRALTTKIFLF